MTEVEHYGQVFIREALPLIREVGNYIQAELEEFDLEAIEVKSLNSLVSYVDKTAEKMLVKGLDRLFPDAGFITEEDVTENADRELTWIIDPLDGTTNFLQAIPFYCVSVALRYRDEIICGAVYEPSREEMFYALADQGAFLNDKPISVSNKNQMSEVILATGFPYRETSVLAAHVDLFQALLSKTRGMRRLGSAALDLCFVACGRLDGYYEHHLNIWDIAAGILIVREAGGKVSSYRPEDDVLDTCDVIAGNPWVCDQLLAKIEEYVLS